MKYGMRERLSGAIILIALAVIFVPMLFDEPAPREERPQPVLTIEQPVDVERRDVPDPQPPASLGEIQSPDVSETPETQDAAPTPSESSDTVDEGVEDATAASPEPPDDVERPVEDPIAELARAADERLAREEAAASSAVTPSASSGEWAVQVGSFGEPANAERLQTQLRDQGFNAYSRPRDNNLTSVYVGPYASSEAGERAMVELKEQANLQGLLVREVE
ncbi:SPOR domain-containing protein [Halomonas sp.]|jgi:DedD protein|uniref:SPOR domain-containing protein n=1 Tax=Halomonas sp. TaxID=1486246 RepID=UPI003562E4EF